MPDQAAWTALAQAPTPAMLCQGWCRCLLTDFIAARRAVRHRLHDRPGSLCVCRNCVSRPTRHSACIAQQAGQRCAHLQRCLPAHCWAGRAASQPDKAHCVGATTELGCSWHCSVCACGTDACCREPVTGCAGGPELCVRGCVCVEEKRGQHLHAAPERLLHTPGLGVLQAGSLRGQLGAQRPAEDLRAAQALRCRQRPHVCVPQLRLSLAWQAGPDETCRALARCPGAALPPAPSCLHGTAAPELRAAG